jgi:hypothetical protein
MSDLEIPMADINTCIKDSFNVSGDYSTRNKILDEDK